MTALKKVQTVIAVLKIPLSIANCISYAKSIVMAMTGNPNFTTPSPTLVSVSEAISALEDAQSEAHTKALGTATKRDVKWADLRKELHALLAYVQGIADKNPEHARDIILSAGMKVRQQGSGRKFRFEARNIMLGSLMLTAPVAGRAGYDWQMGTDGKVWTTLPTTLVAKTEVSGLTPGDTYYFRYRTITTRGGTSDWSHIISVIAL